MTLVAVTSIKRVKWIITQGEFWIPAPSLPTHLQPLYPQETDYKG